MVYGSGIQRKAGDILIIGILLLVTAASLFPILHLIALSFSDKTAATSGFVTIFPIGFTLTAYQAVFDDALFFTTFGVSVQRVLLGGIVQFIITVLMAYPLSRSTKQFRSRNVYVWFTIFTMLFSGGLIPLYMTIKSYGILDSIWSLVLPGAVPVFSVILLMNFFRGLPKELDEAMEIDGAGPWYTLFRMYLPLSLPALATITLFSIVGHWNAFFDGLIFIHNPDKQPLQTYLSQIVVQVNLDRTIMTEEEIKKLLELSNKTVNSAKIFVSMIPVLLLYPFLQKYFITGITLGSVKE
jgi:putative aldouronate transport system permease protein